MIAVTHDYKNTISQIIRPTTQFEADLNIRNVMATRDAEITDNGTLGKAVWSKSVFGVEHEGDYITFEPDYWVVGDNSQKIIPADSSENIESGYVSSETSDEEGNLGLQWVEVIDHYDITDTWEEGVLTFRVEGNMETPDQYEITMTGEAVEPPTHYKGHKFPISIPSDMLNRYPYLGVRCALSCSSDSGTRTYGIKLCDSTRSELCSYYATHSYYRAGVVTSSTISKDLAYFELMCADDTSFGETIFASVSKVEIIGSNSSSLNFSSVLYSFSYEDFAEVTPVTRWEAEITPKTLEMTFGENPYEFIGLTTQFTSAHPSKANITAYLDNEEVLNVNDEIPSPLWIYNEPIPLCNRIVIDFGGSALLDNDTDEPRPYNRVRISDLMLGVSRTFTNSDIISTSQDSFIDPVTSQLPYNNFRMTIQNFDKDYNPDNPEGIWKYFENGQDLTIKYGVETGTGVEWIPNAKLLLSDAPTVEINKATFTASDTLSYLTETYYKGVYSAEGATLYDLAIAVLQDAGVTKYHIPEALQNTTTNAYLPIVSHKECLQLIANAGRCILFCDSEGAICMREELEPSYTLEDNSHADWSSLTSAFFGANDVDYITFESDRWDVGNDKQYIMPTESSEYIANGYVSSVLSGEGGVFSTPVVITINSSIPVNSDSYSITFDNINEIYATDFTVQFYYTEFGNNTLIKQITVTENDSTTWTYDDSIIGYTKVIITITAINVEGNRLKIYNISGGRETDYYLDYTVALERPVLKRGALLRQVDVVKHNYVVDEDTTVFFEEAVSGTDEIVIDHLPATNIQISGQGFGWQTEFDDLGGLVHLVSEDGKVTVTGHDTYYEFREWEQISEISDNLFPIDWANTNTCYLACDVDNPDGLDCHIMCFDNMDYDMIIQATTSGSYRGLWVNEIETDTVGFDIYIQFPTTPSTVTISNIRLLDSNNNVIWRSDANTFASKTNADHKLVGTYAQRTIVKLAGEGTLKVTGNVLMESESTYTLTKNLTGEVCPLDNPLVTTSDLASKMADWLANYCSLRDTYNMKFRQDYRLEPNDVIYIKTDFEELVPARVYQVGFALQGQTGNISVKRIG